MATPPEYNNVSDAIAALSPVGTELATIKGKLCYFEPGWRFQGSDTTFDASGLFVPYSWAGGHVRAAWKGGKDSTEVPNLQWSWTENTAGGGNVQQLLEVTRFNATGVGDQSYLSITPTLSGRMLVYAEILCKSASVNDEMGLELYDATDKYEMTIAAGANAGDIRWNNVTNRDNLYANGTGYIKLLLLVDRTTHLAEIWRYETMECVNSAVVTEFNATALTQLLVGVFNPTANGTGIVYIQNYPALVLIDKIPEP